MKSISKKNALWIVLVSSTLTVMAGAILGPVVQNIASGLGVGQSSAGLIITMHGVFVFLLSPLAGSLIDRVGSKQPYVFGLLLYGVAGGSGLFLDSYIPLLISRAFLGAAVALVFTSITVMILNFYKGRERNRAMGLRGSANNIGATVWPLIGGALGTISWKMPFGVYLLAVPLGFLALIYLPGVERVKTGGGSVFAVFREKTVLFGIYGAMLVANLLLYVNVVYLPEVLEGVGITNTLSVGLFLAGMGVSAGIVASRYDWVRERLHYRRIVPIFFILWSVGFSVAFFGSSTWTYGLSVILFGIGQGLALPTVMLWVGDVVSSSFLGRFSSYLSTFGFLGQFLSPIVFAPFAGWLGVGRVFMVAALISLGGLGLSLMSLHRKD